MGPELYKHQLAVLNKLKSGSILVGGVGSGKSRTALAYYYEKECGGEILKDNMGLSPMTTPKNLYIITTARKRDTLDWEKEMVPFLLSTNRESCDVDIHVDSWNNILKYVGVKDAFFIFDEQRVIGNGVWVQSFLKIVKNNRWILLSATPGDTWMDYIPVFIANGWYKNRTEFVNRHVVFKRIARYPKVDRYLEVSRLIKLRASVLVQMPYSKHTIPHTRIINPTYDKDLYKTIFTDRWNVWNEEPVRDAGQLCYLLRRVVNQDPSRIEAIKDILSEHKKIVVFYNFNYEREALLELGCQLNIPTTEWSGHKHEHIPKAESWIYLVQYAAGAEGWNCVETNALIFYSLNYSYKAMIQAAGRIDRMDTKFTDLYYYYLISTSSIDSSIKKAVDGKKNFNENDFVDFNPREKNIVSNRVEDVFGIFPASSFLFSTKG